MSKANIISKEKLATGIVHVTFQNDDGTRKYEYRGSSARAINRGTDPAGLTGGKLIEHKKKNGSS
jgi:hypothetical protein